MHRQLAATALLKWVCAVALLGCSGGNHSFVPNPISVYLPVTTVEVTAGAAFATVPIEINSPSETALVAVTGLPSGIQVTYAASDTNPSGTLTFTANKTAIAGSYMPTITVTSSGQTASTGFTLIVRAS